MSLRMSIAMVAAAVGLISGFGCNISTCEEGADCDGKWDADEGDRADHQQTCTVYCGRVSICGGQQAAGDFDGCVSSCEDRFRALPEETARICACAEWSSCGDVNEGRCSDDTSGSGGSTSCSGNCNGSGGTASSGGSGPSSGGSAASSGGAASGGSAGTGAGGEAGNPGVPCTGDCDCSGGAICVAGYCQTA